MNVVLRGLALGGEVDACGRLFEEYKVAGLPHDFAAYNSVIESCCVAKKVSGGDFPGAALTKSTVTALLL